MTVNPGFGGQQFIPSQVDKIRRIREMIGERNIDLEVDGGINTSTVGEVVSAGVNVIVAGSSIFNSQASLTENLSTLREAAGG